MGVGQRKYSNPWPPEHMAGALSTEVQELMESKADNWVHYVTGVLHTARISTVEFIMSGVIQWRWWMLSLVIKCERWIIQHDTSVGQRKYLSPQQEDLGTLISFSLFCHDCSDTSLEKAAQTPFTVMFSDEKCNNNTQDGRTQNCISMCTTLQAHIRALNNYSMT